MVMVQSATCRFLVGDSLTVLRTLPDVGPVSPEQKVCHSCDHPWCNNPGHWFLGTNDDNVADRQAKGRGAKVWGEPLNRSRQTHCHRGHPLSGDNLRMIRGQYRT